MNGAARGGFVLISVVVIMFVVMLSVISLSLSALTTRRTTAVESRNVQSFHAAQAGLGRARAYLDTCIYAPSHKSVQCEGGTAWTQEPIETIATVATGFATSSLLASPGLSSTLDSGRYTVTLTSDPDCATVPAPASCDHEELILTSVGSGTGDRSITRLEQRVAVSVSKYDAPIGSVPGALTATGNVTLRGNNPIGGYVLPGFPPASTAFSCTTEKTGSNKGKCALVDGSYSLTGDFKGYSAGEYVEINGSFFGITSNSGSVMSLQPLGVAGRFPPGSLTRVDPVLPQNAAAVETTPPAVAALTVHGSSVSAASYLRGLEERRAALLSLGISESSWNLQAVAESQWQGYAWGVDTANVQSGPFQIEQSSEACAASITQLCTTKRPTLSQYSRLQRIIPSVVTSDGSEATITKGTNAVPYIGETHANFTADTLFSRTFSNPGWNCPVPDPGSSCAKQAFYAQATHVSFEELAASPSYYCGRVVWVGNAPGVTSPANTSQSVSLNCPASKPAVVVVNNEGASFDIGTQTEFNGLLYVMADQLLKQGNGCINGAVLVESTNPAMAADLRGTACPGGDQHDAYIRYDPRIINQLSDYSHTHQLHVSRIAASWKETKLP
ncbi:pilus assembly PilX family protein [Deinococcus malanensis]|nr:pilus assembly PilX N-terminal domain-containing protein [Deinococcus malanensis]